MGAGLPTEAGPGMSSFNSLTPSWTTTSNGPSPTDSRPQQPVQTYSETGEQLKEVKRAGKTTGALIGAVVGTVLVSIILVYLYKQKGASIMRLPK
ncbi:hypothetical protein I302_105082 [Kwoniella bestiolae CBS 10118]|uniref:Uncharacterized protein n=1 Tax=Kwoniella bestiolae CBS 10118 TaxID=1296100 RepID=A0A1B9FS53_9TREE|nr:hypothetical protein I302_08370 [Kwoniella bestiolae CBS 10118]OCF21596.1 hypothetical protein I302_08370 [Kwoniella bestiolae CBS 10118]